jgi:high-affinity iron transporter
MGAASLITLREGLEAALIVSIVMAYLRQLGRADQFGWVALGALAGVAVALAAGVGVYVAIGELEGRAEQLTEGIIALVAVAVLTWMVFWMRRQARTIGAALRSEVDRAMATGAMFGLASLVFIGVLREGLETALFLLAVLFESEAASTGIGAFAGLAVAIALGYVIYQGGRRINLRLFFQATGGLIMIVAAGLFGKGVHELQEAGVFGTLLSPVWNVEANPIVGHGHFAALLKGLVGWSPEPSIEQLAVWALYLAAAGWLFYLDGRLPFGLTLSSVRWPRAVAAEADADGAP